MASIDCNVWSSCVVIVSESVCVLKSFTSLFPRSMLRIGHLPPLCVWRSSCSSLNVILCLEVLSFALYLHLPRRCVLASGWLHFLQSIGPMLCFRLQRYTCIPQTTSYESRRHLYGDCECACMLKSVPVSFAFLRIAPKIRLVVVYVVSLIVVLMPVFILVSFMMVSGLLGVVRLICGHVLRPPTGGSASSNVMSGGASPSTTALAALSAASLYSISVCDLTLPMCVLSCFSSLALSSWSVRFRRSLCN